MAMCRGLMYATVVPAQRMSQFQVGVGASGAIYAIMGGWLSHITCTWGEEDEFDKCGQLTQVKHQTHRQ